MKRTLLAASVALLSTDGMGFEFISAYRYAMSDLETKNIAPTQFDEVLTGAATTYPEDDTWVTDSAAGATALATGEKSYNGAIGMDNDKTSLKTVMEYAKNSGYMTGSVSTSQVNHATPASFFSHHPSRYEYNEIADLMAKDWVSLLEQHGLQVIQDMQMLDQVEQPPVMGLFAPKGLPHAIDEGKDSLARMTSTALRLLSAEDKPFALMIEGSQIDWCGHANDIACAVHEMDSLNKALEVVDAFIKNNPNTLFVMTADHSTGGLTLGRDGEYAWYSDRVMAIESSIAKMRSELLEMDADKWADYVADKVNVELTQEYVDELALAAEQQGEDREDALHKALVYITGDITGTGWTSSGHTAVDVPIFARGPHAEQFRGYMDNTDIGKRLIEIVK